MRYNELSRQCFEEAVIYFEAIWHRRITPMEAEHLRVFVEQRSLGATPDDLRRIAAGCAAELDYLDDMGEAYFAATELDQQRLADLLGV